MREWVTIGHFRMRYPELFATTHELNINCPPGWVRCVELVCDLIQDLCPGVKVECVKQKLGFLRIYLSAHNTPLVRPILELADRISEVQCETCGQFSPTLDRKCTEGTYYISYECQPCREKWVAKWIASNE